jgi:ATP-binding protein involved in chromosome partitioning
MAITQLDEQAVLEVLKTVQDPEIHRDLVSLNMVKDVKVLDPKTVALTVVLTTPACPLKNTIHNDIDAALARLPGSPTSQIKWDAQVSRTGGLPNQTTIPGVKNLIAVGSGKGGVGKTTTAVNLAIALRRAGATVGLLDADIYGPNIPIMTGAAGEPSGRGDKILPFERHHLRIMSIGLLIPEDKPIIWRGPMASGAFRQLLFDVEWGELDYLLIDLPPGTGDIQLTLAQSVPMTGAVMVTTPQDVSVADVAKGVAMFQQVKVPILGIIENMSYFLCPHCNERTDVFDTGGGKRLAERLKVPYLGEIPLDPSVRTGGGQGVPLMVALPDSGPGQMYSKVASYLAGQVSIRNFKQSSIIPLRSV